jgi:type II secretory pathway pseudopilin PulG
MKSPSPELYERNTGFALHELLVVVVVLFLLAGLHIATARGGGQRTRVAQCEANLRQYSVAMQLYASENQDRLPNFAGGENWVWDASISAADGLLSYGMEKRMFYCPGTYPRFNDNLNFIYPSPISLWNFRSGFRVTGYAAALNQSTLHSTNQNTTILPKILSTSLPIQADSDRVLLADATISQNRSGTAANPGPAGSFVNVMGGFQVPHMSPHLKGNLPAGGNIAFKDGHVQWRDFSLMSQRAVSGPGFWW